jgi:TRAP-type C4-dicarboxylate transport system permease small subunit
MKIVIEKIEMVTKIFVGISAGIMCSVIFLEVVMRYLFHRSIFIAEELSRLTFIWTSMLAATLALKKGMHMSVRLFVDKMPNRLRKYIEFSASAFILIFLVSIFFAVLKILPFHWNNLTATMEIPVFWFYVPIPISLGLMIIYISKDIVDILRRIK